MKRKISKKLKDEKIKSLEKIPALIKSHKFVCQIENTDIPSSLLVKMRSEMLNTTIFFVKKNYLLKYYHTFETKKNFFLVFTDEIGIEKLKTYQYNTFLDVGDVSLGKVVIKQGQIKEKKLADLLPTITEKNITFLEDDFIVCEAGQKVDQKQSEILKCLKRKLKIENINIIKIIDTNEIK